jgi:hypothetical protein
MMPKEPGLASLEAISVTLKKTYDTPEDAEWKDHPLEWIRSKPSARIGKIGRLFVTELCNQAELQAKGVGYALLIGKKKFQVRFSTGWSGGGFKFEQLRFEKYEAVICLGITPERAFAWVIPQTVIFGTNGTILKKDGLTPQHKGKGGSETAWINVNVQEIPEWMTPYGDSVADAVKKLKASQ